MLNMAFSPIAKHSLTPYFGVLKEPGGFGNVVDPGVLFGFIPVGPVNPVVPVKPVVPVGPVFPTGPELPVGPLYPVLPLNPVLPVAPGYPV